MVDHLKQLRFERAEEFLVALRPHNDLWQPYPNDWVYRGQYDSSFKLLPTAYRKSSWEDFALPGDRPFDPLAGYQSEILQAQHEYAVLKRFLVDLDRAGIGVPEDIFVRTRFEDANSNDLEFLTDPAIQSFAALAQHHGVPTRLLDWTRSGVHAAYFGAVEAAAQAVNGWMSVWALSLAFVETAQIVESHPAKFPLAPYLRVISTPRATNPNLHAQAGLFALWLNAATVTDLEDVVLRILVELERHDDAAWKGTAPLRHLQLPWSETPKLLRMLSYEQVDGSRMFPGRDGVVLSMRERRLWDRKE